MTVASKSASISSTSTGRGIFSIIGIACLIGFGIDMAIAAFPLNPGSLEWRVGFLRQLSDRSVVPMIGLGFLMYACMDARALRKQLGYLGMAAGVVCLMLGVLAIRDGVTLQSQTLKNIDGRAAQVQQQIQQAQAQPPAGAKITPQDVEQAMKQIEERSKALQDNAKGSILKTGANSVGNLVVVGLALIGLGRYGVRPPRN
jgi:hypothetical protein